MPDDTLSITWARKKSDEAREKAEAASTVAHDALRDYWAEINAKYGTDLNTVLFPGTDDESARMDALELIAKVTHDAAMAARDANTALYPSMW